MKFQRNDIRGKKEKNENFSEEPNQLDNAGDTSLIFTCICISLHDRNELNLLWSIHIFHECFRHPSVGPGVPAGEVMLPSVAQQFSLQIW